MKSIEEILSNPNISNDVKLTNILYELGIPCRFAGFDYIKTAVKLILSEPEVYNSQSNSVIKLMHKVAEAYNSTSSKVERGIRYAVEHGMSQGRADDWNNLFRFAIKPSGKVPNSEFLFRIALILKEGV